MVKPMSDARIKELLASLSLQPDSISKIVAIALLQKALTIEVKN